MTYDPKLLPVEYLVVLKVLPTHVKKDPELLPVKCLVILKELPQHVEKDPELTELNVVIPMLAFLLQ